MKYQQLKEASELTSQTLNSRQTKPISKEDLEERKRKLRERLVKYMVSKKYKQIYKLNRSDPAKEPTKMTLKQQRKDHLVSTRFT